MSGERERGVGDAQIRIDLLGASYDRRGSMRARAELPPLERLRAAGVLRDVDVHFARTTASLVDERDPFVLLGLAMASHAPGAGHVCVELGAPDRVGPRERAEDEWTAERAWWPGADEWRAALVASALVASALVATPEEWASGAARALVLDGERLYLARYWAYERRLLRALAARARVVRDDVDEALLRDGLARLFPRDASAPEGPDLQRAAACAAVLRSLAIITGGPGTGKTTTVLRVLALLVEQAAARRAPPPRIRLAAPTGKAAARLSASLRDGLARFDVSREVAHAIPTTATTIHRLLGAQARTPTRFRHDAANPLAADVVVVDEASMADLALAAKLVDAVPAEARLILLGDPDQLVSVEAGAILGDVCGDASARRTRAFAGRLVAICDEPGLAERSAPEGERVAPIADCIVRLTASRRFRDDAGIGALVRAINDGDADRALAVLRDDPSGEVSFVALDAVRADVAAIRRLAVPRYRPAVRARGPREALAALDDFRVLAAHREGALGVAGLNDAIARALAGEGTIPHAATLDAWYPGQPILVTANEPALDLYNGDVGIVLRDADGSLRAWFRANEGSGISGVRGIAPARLPAHETTFAMTVHKAQGSEFDHVVLVLPSSASRVLTRELLYTAVSRARRTVTVVGSGEVVRSAIGRRIGRASGLRDGLWGLGSED